MPLISHDADMKRLRAAVADLRRQRLAAPVAQLVDQMFTACEALERDLAGAEMRIGASEAQIRQETAEREYLFDALPVPCVELDGSGTIVSANPAAATLLNTSRKHLEGRLLLHFTEDRPAFELFLQKLSLIHLGGDPLLSCNIRPREHAAVPVECSAVAGGAHRGTVLVFFGPTRPITRKGLRTATLRADADTQPSL
jgi:PAS domain-containing protein